MSLKQTVFSAALAVLAFIPEAAMAQTRMRTERVWDIPLGTPISELPRIFFELACGTNGGPPSTPLAHIRDFAQCPDVYFGLHEVAFRYDDTAEYVARARRDLHALGPTLINTVQGQPVINSLFIDVGGRVRGYRIVTDPKADPVTRRDAFSTTNFLRGRFGIDGWRCVNREPGPRESTIDGVYINNQCSKTLADREVRIESRFFRKPGQREVDDQGRPTVNEFESWSALEVLQGARSLAPKLTPVPPTAAIDARSPEERFLVGASTACPNCNLEDADLRRRDLSNSNLSGANLSGALLHRATLRKANLGGANLTNANLNLADLTAANLEGARLDRAMLFEARASNANLRNATLTFALLGGVSLAESDLTGANLNDADLGNARLGDANLTGAHLERAYFYGAELLNAKLEGVFADKASFGNAKLDHASLIGGSFIAADFISARLVEADLTRAIFLDARLTLANMFQAKIEGAKFQGALLP